MSDHKSECCGSALDRGLGGAHEGWCSTCEEQCCSACAPIFESEAGYGDDGTGVRTLAVCAACHVPEPDPDRERDERAEADRLERETLDREPHRRGRE